MYESTYRILRILRSAMEARLAEIEAQLAEICPVLTPCCMPKGYVARDLHSLAAARDEDPAAVQALLAGPARDADCCALTGRYVPTASTAAPDDAEDGASIPCIPARGGTAPTREAAAQPKLQRAQRAASASRLSTSLAPVSLRPTQRTQPRLRGEPSEATLRPQPLVRHIGAVVYRPRAESPLRDENP